MRDSDALLTLVGGELEAIYHGDPEYYGNLLTKQHGPCSKQACKTPYSSTTILSQSTNHPQYGINGDLMWLNRSPDIEERTQGDVLHLCGAEY